MRRFSPTLRIPHRTSSTWGAITLSVVMALACKSSTERQLDSGRRALGRGEYRNAIELYDQILLEDSESALAAQALYEKGEILYLQLRDVDAARAAFRRILREHGEEAVARDARRMLARMYQEELGAPDKAMREYERLLSEAVDPLEERVILLSLAECRYRLDDMRGAADDYRRVIGEPPYEADLDPAFLRLAHIESLEGRFDEAADVLEALLAQTEDPSSRRQAFAGLVEAHILARRFAAARTALARADRELPEDEDLSVIAFRLTQRETEERSLDDGDIDSAELLMLLQRHISWGKGRRTRTQER